MPDMTLFELLTPLKLLQSEPVDMVVVPGSEGDMGILPHHMPIISTLRAGVVQAYKNQVKFFEVFVTGGYADANEERVTILADEVLEISEVTLDLAAKRLEAAHQAVAHAKTPREQTLARQQVMIAEAMQFFATRH